MSSVTRSRAYYVGVARASRTRPLGFRPKAHISEALRYRHEQTSSGNLPKLYTILEILDRGAAVKIDIISDGLVLADAIAEEVRLIAHYGRDRDGGTLTNGSKGGEHPDLAIVRSKTDMAQQPPPETYDLYTAAWRAQHRARLKQTLDQAHAQAVLVADDFARRFLPTVLAMQNRGMGLRAIASAMNAHGYAARHGGPWTDQTVRQLLKRRHHVIKTEAFDDQPRVQFIGWGRRR